MKKHIFYLLPSLYLLVLFASCEDDVTSDNADCLMPIKIGNSWSYTSTTKTDYSTSTFSYKYTIGEKVTINGYSCFIQELSSLDGKKNVYIHHDEFGNLTLIHCAYLIGNDREGNVVEYGGFSEVDTLIKPSIHYKKMHR